jgi:protein-S-isoprenylcysteine O-methyltransferase Ste14
VRAIHLILYMLPLAVFFWMMIGAVVVFSRDAGQRSLRGLGIVITIWGALAARAFGAPAPFPMQLAGAAVCVVAFVIYQWAALSIRGRTFSYAGNTDLPEFVHQSGPYASIRNPFYLSYLLTAASTVIMWPTRWGIAVLVFAVIYFQWLVRFEEGKFERSAVAADYAQYKARTGRFLPPLLRRR